MVFKSSDSEALCFWQLWTCQMSQTVDKQTAVRVNTCSSWAAECSNTSQLLLFFHTDLDLDLSLNPWNSHDGTDSVWIYSFLFHEHIHRCIDRNMVRFRFYTEIQIKRNKADKYVLQQNGMWNTTRTIHNFTARRVPQCKFLNSYSQVSFKQAA